MTEIFQPFPKLARLSRGFMDPGGVVVYHAASRASFKKTFDDRHKESIAA